jgi:tyrosine-protein phosphatase YwqE
MDEHFDRLVEEDTPLITLYNKLVLVEFSFVSQPFDLKEKLFNLQIKGYQPVIAHPERYEYLAAKKYIYEELKMMGCLFQLNLLSLAGYYGKMPQELANWLIGKKYVDLLGTDLHHERHLDALRSSHKIMSSVDRLLDEGVLLNSSLQV